MKKKVLLGVVLGLFVFASQAGADVIFSDGFEGYTVNTTAWTNHYATDQNTVRNTPTVDSGQCLEVCDTGTSSEMLIYKSISYTFVSDEYVQVDVYARSKQTNETWAPVALLGGGGWSTVARVYFSGNGVFGYYDGGWNDSTTAYSADTNYHIRAIFTPDVSGSNDTWKFYVDNMVTPVASGLGWAADVADLDKYSVWGHYGHTAEGYIDSVNVQNIPEPATMALLLLGLPFALRRRR